MPAAASPHRPSRSREGEVGGAVSRPDVRDVREEDVVVAVDPRSERGVVALPAEMEHCRPGLAESRDGQLVERAGTLAAPEDQHDRPVVRQAEAVARLGAAGAASSPGWRGP